MANQIIGVKVNKFASIILGVAIGLSGCGGSGTNNDQGTSFLATGYKRVDATGTLTTTPLTGIIFSLYDNTVNTGVLAGMTVENRLTSQFLRVDQISCSYEVPGSNIALYQDSFNSSIVIPAAVKLSTADGVSAITPTSATMSFQLLSGDVQAYFANRTNDLPAFPFRMNVSCHAVATSQAGDVFESNQLGIQVIVTDDTNVVDEPDDTTTGGATVTDETITDTEDSTESSSSSSEDTSAL